MKILLDYFFPISVITPTPAANTAFLKQVLVIAKPNGGGTAGEITLCTSMSQVQAITDDDNISELFSAGMNRVYVLQANTLDEVAGYLTPNPNDFYTVLVSSEFDPEGANAEGTITISDYANLLTDTPDTIEVAGVEFVAQAGAAVLGEATFQAAASNDDTATSLAAQINAHPITKDLVKASVQNDNEVLVKAKEQGVAGNSLSLDYSDNDSGGPSVGASVTGSGNLTGGINPSMNFGQFSGVIGVSSNDMDFLNDQSSKENICAFYTNGSVGAKNMFHAFGALLSNQLNWRNQQYIEMPFANDVDELGEAENLFDSKISFVISDDEFGNRLGLFAAGGKAIVAPYISKNLRVNIQSRALQYVSANQPQYTIREATLLEQDLQEEVIQDFIDRRWIEEGNIEISLQQDNFVASGSISISEPKALWRIFGEMIQTI